MDLEPVGSPAVSGARLGHPHHQTFSQSAGFTGSSVLLVNNTSVVVLTFSYHRLIVTSPAEERFAALAGEGSEVEASSGFITDSAQLVLHWVHLVELEQYKTLDSEQLFIVVTQDCVPIYRSRVTQRLSVVTPPPPPLSYPTLYVSSPLNEVRSTGCHFFS